MARTVKLDLRGAPPVTGGMRDHIPPGTYRVKVVNVDDGTSKSGKRMWTASYKVSEGDQYGSNLGDNFVLEDNSGQPSKMGLGRLHHFLLCLGVPAKEAQFNIDLDMLTDRECIVDVQDEEFESNGQKRQSSAIKGYKPLKAEAPKAPEQPAAPAPAPEPEIPTGPGPESISLGSETAEAVEEEIDDLFK